MQPTRLITLLLAVGLAALGALSTPHLYLAPLVGSIALAVSMLVTSRSRTVFVLRCATAAMGVTLAASALLAPEPLVLTFMRAIGVSMVFTVGASLVERHRIPHVATYAVGLLLMGCEPGCAGGQLTPGAKKSLGEVVSRVDVTRLLQCAGAGDAKAIAKCLGARVLTEGLEEALLRARQLAEQAEEVGNEAAGAADITEEQKAALAVDLDHALDDLGAEISKANNL